MTADFSASRSGNQAGGLVTLGESMALVAAAHVGSLASNRDLRLSVAGAESNVAIGVVRLGGSATWISRLGADGFGDLLRRELRAEGVSVLAATDPVRPTGLMVKERPNALRTHVRYYRAGSAASAMTAFDVVAEPIAEAQVLHVTGITPALGPGPASAVQLALDIAREHGTVVSLDLNYRSALWSREDAGQALRPLVGRANIVFAGPEEASLVVPDEPVQKMAHALAELGPAEVVLKLGAEGAFTVAGGQEWTTQPVEVPVVDTVGAGDAFVAGYLAELMAGEDDIERRLATAAAAGAFACTTLGDWEGLPTRADLAGLGGSEPVHR